MTSHGLSACDWLCAEVRSLPDSLRPHSGTPPHTARTSDPTRPAAHRTDRTEEQRPTHGELSRHRAGGANGTGVRLSEADWTVPLPGQQDSYTVRPALIPSDRTGNKRTFPLFSDYAGTEPRVGGSIIGRVRTRLYCLVFLFDPHPSVVLHISVRTGCPRGASQGVRTGGWSLFSRGWTGDSGLGVSGNGCRSQQPPSRWFTAKLLS